MQERQENARTETNLKVKRSRPPRAVGHRGVVVDIGERAVGPQRRQRVLHLCRQACAERNVRRGRKMAAARALAKVLAQARRAEEKEGRKGVRSWVGRAWVCQRLAREASFICTCVCVCVSWSIR